MSNRLQSLRVGFAVATLGLLSAVGAARADLIGSPLVVTATSSDGLSASWTLPETAGQWDNGRWTWNAGTSWSYDFWSGTELLGSISGLRVEYVSDPQVTVNFAAQAGALDTTFTFSSGLLTFAPITNGTATASAGITVTDGNANGALLTGNHAGGFAYRADYNGLVPTGINYAQYMTSISAPALSGASDAGNSGPTSLGGVQSDMSAQFAFTLSRRDSASGTSTFEIVPSPAGLALLGLAGLTAGRRKR